MERIQGLEPMIYPGAKILILGSMPSVKSLKQQMYYANPTNRFWKVLSAIYDHSSETIEDKIALLQDAKIGLWDSCQSCVRTNSADATIKEVICNDIPSLCKDYPTIEKIICNGKTSYTTFTRYFPQYAGKVLSCPSTSAANAKFRLLDLIEIYERTLKNE